MAATIVFGAVAASRIGISQFPDVDFPNIEACRGFVENKHFGIGSRRA